MWLWGCEKGGVRGCGAWGCDIGGVWGCGGGGIRGPAGCGWSTDTGGECGSDVVGVWGCEAESTSAELVGGGLGSADGFTNPALVKNSQNFWAARPWASFLFLASPHPMKSYPVTRTCMSKTYFQYECVNSHTYIIALLLNNEGWMEAYLTVECIVLLLIRICWLYLLLATEHIKKVLEFMSHDSASSPTWAPSVQSPHGCNFCWLGDLYQPRGMLLSFSRLL